MPNYGLYQKPFTTIGGPGKLKGSNMGGTSAAATQANRGGKGANRLYYIVDANGLHVAKFGPFATLSSGVASAKTSFELMLSDIITKMNL